MKIWAHTLFKNEERWLWFSVTSVIDYVDKVLLWDTGSTDKSWKIAKQLKAKYKDKIELRQYGEVTVETFPEVRQAMLDATNSDWFIVVDGDEVWWESSVKDLIQSITSIANNKEEKFECFVVPTVNLVGDMYHKLPENAGRYKFGDRIGNYNLRAVKRNIEGLHSEGNHGVWGWADKEDKQIQERNTFKFINAPYLHMSFLPRGNSFNDDAKVPKRAKKLKYETGESLPLDFYFPESMFSVRPNLVSSPWMVMNNSFKLKAMILAPFKKAKRRFINAGVGY